MNITAEQQRALDELNERKNKECQRIMTLTGDEWLSEQTKLDLYLRQRLQQIKAMA